LKLVLLLRDEESQTSHSGLPIRLYLAEQQNIHSGMDEWSQNPLARAGCASYLEHAMNSAAETIAAISTAPGEAGIAIVRVSGPASLQIADRIFKCPGAVPSERPAGTFLHGFVKTSGASREEDLDEVVLLVYRAPRSYTREDVVEIQGHGGRTSAKRILRAILDAGARPAEPGEFTKRAFLNGRIDLLQAEAVADLIAARSDRAAQAAMNQLEGSLSSSFSSIYDHIFKAACDLEASLDFPEEDLPPSLVKEAAEEVESARRQLENLLATWEEGHLLRDGALVVISGKPNVGKSTLLNRLLGIGRAIVHDEPGTTRDSIEEEMILDGIPVRLVDTAGLCGTENAVERKGVERAEALIAKADINLHVIDSSRDLDKDDREHLRKMNPARSVIVLNKIDLGQRITADKLKDYASVSCNMLIGNGLDDLKTALASKLNIHCGAGDPHAVISERHRQVILGVLEDLSATRDLLCSGREDLLAPAISNLRHGLESLGTITGRSYEASLLDSIFNRFCIGK